MSRFYYVEILCKIVKNIRLQSGYIKTEMIEFVEQGILEDTGDYVVFKDSKQVKFEVFKNMKTFKQEIGRDSMRFKELKWII